MLLNISFCLRVLLFPPSNVGWLIGQSNGLLIALVCLEYCGLLIAQSEWAVLIALLIC